MSTIKKTVEKVVGKVQDLGTKVVFGSEKEVKLLFHDIVDKDMQGKDVSLSDFHGSVLLVVNFASN